MQGLYLGIDVSTTAAKCLVYDAVSNVCVARGQHSFEPLSSQIPGRAEQNPSEWISGLEIAVAAALAQVKDRSRVSGIGVSGQQHGLVALDETGQVIRPAKLWCDVESANEARELSETYGFELVPGFTASKILWLKRKEPENFLRLQHVLLPHDFINFWLTGRHVMERGDASGTGVWNVQQQCFSREQMDAIDDGLHRCFPELVGADDVIGTLQPSAAKALGLSSDVIVAPGSGDNAASALGSGAVTPGVWVMSLGTSGTLFGPSDTPVEDQSGTVAPFCDATGKWLPLICTQNCAGAAEEVCRAFGLSHEELTKLASKQPAGCDGMNFLPYLTGERTPNWPHATGALLGLTPGCLAPGRVYRAALEAATYSLYAGMQLLVRQHGAAATELRLVGGGSRNKLWRQIVADVFQLPLRIPLEHDSAALGVALQAAAVHIGTSVATYIMQAPPALDAQVVQPNNENAETYQAAFRRHQHLGSLLYQPAA